MAVWVCPGCKRRVPDRIGVCHCGVRKEQAAPPAPVEARPATAAARPAMAARTPGRGGAPENVAISTARTVAREAWPYLVLFVLALAGAAAWGILRRPEVIPPILGYGAGYRRPGPSPTPRPALPKPR